MKSRNLLRALLPAFRQANTAPKRLRDNLQSPRIFASLGAAYAGCVIGICLFGLSLDILSAAVLTPFLLFSFAPWIPGVNFILLVAVISLLAFSVSRRSYYWLGVVVILFGCTTYFTIDAWRVG